MPCRWPLSLVLPPGRESVTFLALDTTVNGEGGATSALELPPHTLMDRGAGSWPGAWLLKDKCPRPRVHECVCARVQMGVSGGFAAVFPGPRLCLCVPCSTRASLPCLSFKRAQNWPHSWACRRPGHAPTASGRLPRKTLVYDHLSLPWWTQGRGGWGDSHFREAGLGPLLGPPGLPCHPAWPAVAPRASPPGTSSLRSVWWPRGP